MIYTTAQQSDLPEILSLFRAATNHMDQQGVLQWDEIYPDESVLRDDIAQCTMTLGWIDGRIAVVFVLEYCKEDDYESADWRYCTSDIVVLHRLCVHPDFQGQGVARTAMDYLEQQVLSSGISAIRLDAFSQNPGALHLYESRGYEKAGEIRYRKGLFYLYEKKL